MHVYRYRSSNLLSQKGLLYDEWYFASKDELNDPIDMQPHFEFSTSGWLKLLSNLWKNKEHAEVAATHFSQLGQISYEQLINDFGKHEKLIIEKMFKTSHLTLDKLSELQDSLSHLLALLNIYGPGSGYSISLSRTSTDMLMWSHYASSHSGFCLIYRPINGRLSQCPIRKKDSLTVSDNHDSGVPIAFDVEDINYEDEVYSLDAYSLLPALYTDQRFHSETARLDWHRKIRTQLLTKNKCWQYEQECRLMLPQPSRWVSGKSTYNSLQRLFYYDFNQVVGVIFGARMPPHDRESLRHIITHKLKAKYSNIGANTEKTYIFDFLYQQAEICSSSRKVKLIDLDINFMGTELKPGSKQYADRLDKWKNGEGMAIQNGAFYYDAIP